MQIVMRESLNDSIDNVWATISDFGGLGRYFSPVVKCNLEGSGVGARRVVTLKTPTGDEVVVVERLESLDAESKRISYSIADATGFPFKDGYVGTMQLKDLGNKKCELEWTACIEAREGTAEQITRDFIRG